MGNCMTQMLFDSLKSANLVKGNQVKFDTVDKMSFASILDFIEQISLKTVYSEKIEDVPPYIYSASLSLGGGRYGCEALRCRKNKLNEIARFAALYSDKVYIHNFVSAYSPTFGHPPDNDSYEFREGFIDDLTLLLEIQPLVESGVVQLFTPSTHYCPVCFAEKVFGSRTGKRIKAARSLLENQILDKLTVQVKYNKDDEYPYETCDLGLEDIYGHEIFTEYENTPEIIAGDRKILKQIHSGETIFLSKKQITQTNYAKQIASTLLRSCTYHLSVSNLLKTTVVTDSNVDVDILSYITNNKQIEQKNRITTKHLSAIVPFAGDVPVSWLSKLRERESDSFIQFRSALSKSIEVVSKHKDNFTVRDAKLLYADVIAPEISRLEKKVKEAKRDLVMKPLSSAVGTVAVIGFGAYTGMIPAEISELARVFGLTQTIFNTVSKIAELSDINKSIRPEEYYFLWKVKNLS